jgi:hypothetical protein
MTIHRRPTSRSIPWRIRALLLVAIFAGTACSLGTTGLGEPPQGALRVLFVGNSLTYYNDLPRTVADLAAAANQQECYCVAIAHPDFALEDHLALGEAERELRRQQYDYVILQQGPSSLPSSRENLVQNAQMFRSLIEGAGATAVLYSPWPQYNRRGDFVPGRESYRAAAEAIGGKLAPAGDAWLAAWEQDALLPLYNADGLHPSRMGTYLAALVIFERLYARNSDGLPPQARVDGAAQNWTADVIQLLRTAADSAVARQGHP